MPYPDFAPAVQPLQTLNQEFDVADAAGRQLDVDLDLCAAPPVELFVNACAGQRHRLHFGKVRRCGVDQRLDELEQLAARSGVAGRHARLDQHLQFPVARAPLVVVPGAIQRKAYFALRAVRTQAQIHAIGAAVRGERRKHAGELQAGLLEKFEVADCGRPRGFAGSAIHEQQIDIGAVVQLAAAQLPYRHDR